jgi:hypothetical protein
MKARRRFNQWLVLGLGLAALTASGAQAAKGPGAATVQVTAAAVRPIEHPGPLSVDTDVVTRYLINHHVAVRPVEHPGPLAVDTTDVVSRYLVNHPAAVPAPHEGGSSWDVVGLAAGSGLGALAIALAGFALVHRRRSATAALQS